jgi:hypothetical protein
MGAYPVRNDKAFVIVFFSFLCVQIVLRAAISTKN